VQEKGLVRPLKLARALVSLEESTAILAHFRGSLGRRRAPFLIFALDEMANYKEEGADRCQKI